MAIFNQKNNNQVPSELEPYYDGPKWRVWVRRAVYVVLMLAVLFGIFLLGRAVYRSVANSDSDNDTAQTQEQRDNDGRQAEEKATQSNNDTQSQQGGQGGANQGGNTDAPDDQNGANTTTPNAIPRTGDDPTDQPSALPATGG